MGWTLSPSRIHTLKPQTQAGGWGWNEVMGMASLSRELAFLWAKPEWGQGECGHLTARTQALARNQTFWLLDVAFPPSKTVRKWFLLFKHPAYGTLYGSPSWLPEPPDDLSALAQRGHLANRELLLVPSRRREDSSAFKDELRPAAQIPPIRVGWELCKPSCVNHIMADMCERCFKNARIVFR